MVRLVALSCLLLTGASHAPFAKALVAQAMGEPGPPVRPASLARAGIAPRPGTVARSRDGLFYVEAKVNGAPVRFVVDTGASVVILSAADATRAAVGARGGVDVETANGASAMHRANIRQVIVGGRTLADVDAAIVDHDLPVSLLGQSALSQLTSVTLKGDRLVLE